MGRARQIVRMGSGIAAPETAVGGRKRHLGGHRDLLVC